MLWMGICIPPFTVMPLWMWGRILGNLGMVELIDVVR
jgi:hypothetical protein